MQTASPTAAESALPRFAVFIALLSSMMALTALSIDIMLTAFPEFRSDFGLTGANPEQLLITVYLAGFAAGQLVALLGRSDVLHHHHEVMGVGIPADVQDVRRPDAHVVLEVTVEADLAGVRVDGNCRGPADLTL